MKADFTALISVSWNYIKMVHFMCFSCVWGQVENCHVFLVSFSCPFQLALVSVSHQVSVASFNTSTLVITLSTYRFFVVCQISPLCETSCWYLNWPSRALFLVCSQFTFLTTNTCLCSPFDCSKSWFVPQSPACELVFRFSFIISHHVQYVQKCWATHFFIFCFQGARFLW